MPPDDSFEHLMARLNSGDDRAAAALFERFARRLLAMARSRLEAVRRKEDPEDVLQSVLRSFFTRQHGGEFDVTSWDSLWRVLALLTVRKCANRIAYFHAACRDVRREVTASPSQSADSWLGPADEPTPSEAAVLTDTLEQLMQALEASDRDVLTLQLQGYTIPEISRQVHRSERTVCRILERVRRRLRRLQGQGES